MLEDKLNCKGKKQPTLRVFFDPIEYTIEKREGIFAGKTSEYQRPYYTNSLRPGGDYYTSCNL